MHSIIAEIVKIIKVSKDAVSREEYMMRLLMEMLPPQTF